MKCRCRCVMCDGRVTETFVRTVSTSPEVSHRPGLPPAGIGVSACAAQRGRLLEVERSASHSEGAVRRPPLRPEHFRVGRQRLSSTLAAIPKVAPRIENMPVNGRSIKLRPWEPNNVGMESRGRSRLCRMPLRFRSTVSQRRQVPAVDIKDLARDVRGRLGAEKNSRSTEIVQSAEALQRDLRQHRALP